MHAPVDVALALLYTVAWITVLWLRLPQTRARMAAAPLGKRARDYQETILIQWTLTGLVLARLWWGHLPASSIGLGLPRGVVGWVISALAVALAFWALRKQERFALGSERGQAAVARQLSKMAWMLPRVESEFRWFHALSVTAGVCEETLFRGHLLAFLDSLVGPWVGTVVAVALFGLGHAYQGRKGILRTAQIGLVMALVYRATGSLLAPIVMHAVMDWGACRMVEKALSRGIDLGSPAAGASVAPGSAAPQALAGGGN